ncbi:IclR family transcriptional regulator [Planotetraspora kaengkrachanensis]|uniref:IclR family transcriptional regulator n=1 Tax=Planotetraspora kaengkrachanensis TaxID=575193 RepID=A0A8J3PYB6_9ACTN|nr:IclR family transcriptional regulator [Planotetraspora kaengkrachanensis]
MPAVPAVSGPSVTSKVLAILGAFTYLRPERTLTDISRAAHLPLSTVHRLVNELVAWGALERSSDGSYRIGLRLWEIGALSPRGSEVRETALRYIADLYAHTGNNVALTTLDGESALAIDWIVAERSAHLLGRTGTRIPLHATGAGLVLLAHAPLDLRQKVLEGSLHRFTTETLVEPDDLRRALSDIRRRGYVVSCRQFTDRSTSVAAPVSIGVGGATAALSVIIPATEDWRKRVPVVVGLARKLSAALKSRALEWRHT